jgi:Plasmid encoded RepA protein
MPRIRLGRAKPVPMDTRALRVLNNSPLALDLYAWATYKAYAITLKGQAQFVSYHDFMAQLGTDYSDPKNFKKKLLATLKKVQAVYPQLKIESVPGGLKIHPCKTAIPLAGGMKVQL